MNLRTHQLPHPKPPQRGKETFDEVRRSPIEEKVERILTILNQINRRDRWRTVGGFFRSVISMIPLLLFLGSLWYLYAYGDVLLERLTYEAVKQAAALTGQNLDSILKQLPSSNLGGLLHLLR